MRVIVCLPQRSGFRRHSASANLDKLVRPMRVEQSVSRVTRDRAPASKTQGSGSDGTLHESLEPVTARRDTGTTRVNLDPEHGMLHEGQQPDSATSRDWMS